METGNCRMNVGRWKMEIVAAIFTACSHCLLRTVAINPPLASTGFRSLQVHSRVSGQEQKSNRRAG